MRIVIFDPDDFTYTAEFMERFLSPFAQMIDRDISVSRNEPKFLFLSSFGNILQIVLSPSSRTDKDDGYGTIFGKDISETNMKDGVEADPEGADFLVKDKGTVLAELRGDVLYILFDIFDFDDDEEEEIKQCEHILKNILFRLVTHIKGRSYAPAKEYERLSMEWESGVVPRPFSESSDELGWRVLHKVVASTVAAAEPSSRYIAVYDPNEGSKVPAPQGNDSLICVWEEGEDDDSSDDKRFLLSVWKDEYCEMSFDSVRRTLHIGLLFDLCYDDVVNMKGVGETLLKAMKKIKDFDAGDVNELLALSDEERNAIVAKFVENTTENIHRQIYNIDSSIQDIERRITENRKAILRGKRELIALEETRVIKRRVFDSLHERITKAITDMLRLPYHISVDGHDSFTVTVPQVTLESDGEAYLLGAFQIEVFFNTGDMKIHNLTAPRKIDGTVFAHPAVVQGGSIEAIADTVGELLGSYEFATIVTVVVRFLSDLNEKNETARDRLRFWKS